jgi:hypothetical protein
MRVRGLLAGVLALLACAVEATAADAVPLPDQDPFYAVPAGIAGLANGTILGSRQITAFAGPLPLPASAWQLKYKTLDNQDQATTTVATVLVPEIPWTGRGPRPLVSYQTAEDGVGSKCSPSYALGAGLGAGGSNSEAETSLITLALLRGWGVVAPDYEGLRSDFLGASIEAHSPTGLRARRRPTTARAGSRARRVTIAASERRCPRPITRPKGAPWPSWARSTSSCASSRSGTSAS